MYLKSLVLKGFKSFADKSVLTVEPGITAIVGPNGSGKSNISDAVLWVLGERSAKNLRGQAMEDIIFSGSAARKAVSVAEVELVLDNSDGTIPVDFDEVSIARRMFRSGESEYLVNGAVVRRLDVLEILHDSGIGTGTHSIISQGSLDTILQSKPEDRRALIEEAAGVLKHKQRKEKSSKKIEAMDHHLDRVKDVAAEVERQLGPLERKAKRAQAYKEAKEKLTDIRLSLAVDDLRKLQIEWENVCNAEKRVGEELSGTKEAVEAAEKKVSDVQEAMRRKTEDAGELTRMQRRSSRVSERLDSCEKVLRERRRGSVEYRTNLLASLESNAEKVESSKRELAASNDKLLEIRGLLETSTKQVKSLESELAELETGRKQLESDLTDIETSIRKADKELADAQKEKAQIQEGLSDGLAHEKLVEARRHELSSELDRVKAEHEAALSVLEDANKLFEQLKAEEALAQEELVKLFETREQARTKYEEEIGKSKEISSEIKALERAQISARRGNDALAWVIDNTDAFSGSVAPLVKSLRAPKSVEELVENLLGEDLASLAVDERSDASEIAKALLSKSLHGDVGLVPRTGNVSELLRAQKCDAGKALVDYFDDAASADGLVAALFGDVVVCKSISEALEAQKKDTLGLRFATLDGCLIWPTGKIRVFGHAVSQEESVLARQRRCDDLGTELQEIEKTIDQLELARAEAEEDYRAMQARSLQASQAFANQKGVLASAKTEEGRLAAKLSSYARELEDIASQVNVARETVSGLRPKMEEVERKIEALTAERESLVASREKTSDKAAPLRAQSDELTKLLSAARLEHAKLTERDAYARRMVDTRKNEIESLQKSSISSRITIEEKSVAIERAQVVIGLVERLATSLQRNTRQLDSALAASENATSDAHEDAARARLEAREAHDAYDAVSERMTQVRVEKSRLEIQVDAAVNAVVKDCGMPLDKASEIPQLENRRTAEDEAFKLERRIRNMGAINPDAAEEYAALKERYDFLAAQLSDMEQARKSLRQIMRVIDNRMKDDFARTFAQVNENFSEIFSTLFPGGTASLVLDDPDDIENSGVEVTAQPRGKRLTKMMLMSGGEKSLTALALLFAVYKTRSTPFYILDEVEAALDDTNLRRLISYIDTLREQTQLIMITHQRRTMEMADVLFGVSMQADGVTKVISQKLERALENAD